MADPKKRVFCEGKEVGEHKDPKVGQTIKVQTGMQDGNPTYKKYKVRDVNEGRVDVDEELLLG